MAKFSRTWWGERFIEALEQFTDPARLKRGRSYAKGGKVLNYKLSTGEITATVRGSVNPYFGVYKEPRYKVSIAITPISVKQWSKVIQEIASKASFVSKLLMNEVPDRIEEVFAKTGLHLLPHSSKDFKTDCSCPDWANPCKHIAGVYYLVASELDHNPFLLFELRGLSKEALKIIYACYMLTGISPVRTRTIGFEIFTAVRQKVKPCFGKNFLNPVWHLVHQQF